MSNSEQLRKAKRNFLSQVFMTKLHEHVDQTDSTDGPMTASPRSPSGSSDPGDDFMSWVDGQGIEINGIDLDFFEDRMVGVLTAQPLKVQESDSVQTNCTTDLSPARRNSPTCPIQGPHQCQHEYRPGLPPQEQHYSRSPRNLSCSQPRRPKALSPPVANLLASRILLQMHNADLLDAGVPETASGARKDVPHGAESSSGRRLGSLTRTRTDTRRIVRHLPILLAHCEYSYVS